MYHQISSGKITVESLLKIIHSGEKISLSSDSVALINKCRNYLDNKLEKSISPIYGITTGFGSLHNKTISRDQLNKLQENLVKSHACGTGPAVMEEIVRLMLLLKIIALSKGISGVQLITVQRLIDFFNEGIYPVV